MKNPFDSQWRKGFYQQHRWTIFVAQALVFTLVGYLLARAFVSPSAPPAERDGNGAAGANVAGGPSMWTCSMHPQIRSPKPGDCPICGMDLIPVARTSGTMRMLTLSPETQALMNIAATPVERKYVSHEIPMVGKVAYDETQVGYITAWVPGRLDRLYVDYTGVQVNKGDHMVYIYSPELYAAQEELIQALKYRTDRQSTTRLPTVDLVEAAREKLRLLGLTEEQITDIEKQNRPTDHLTVYSPVSGVVIDKLKQEGDYVKTGERIYTVANLNQVWVHLDAYETDLPWIRYGQDVTITTEAHPGEEFHGRIAFVQPVLNDKTRTVKVRVNLPNVDGKLKPDMFVHAIVRPSVAAGGRVMDASLAGKWISPMHPEIVKDEPGTCDICGMELVRAESRGYVTPDIDEKQAPLVIPYSAALVTGRRAIVYVELPVMPTGLEAAYQGIGAAIDAGDLESVRQAFSAFSNVLDRPYEQPATDFARGLWNRYADRLAEHALAGTRVQSQQEATNVMARIERIMNPMREEFGPIGQPTFEGREIVLGPRAGNYYLVRHGLEEGELVVTQGNFKIDAEIQIQAKPSMMTPEGSGGGGHDHGGADAQKSTGGRAAGHAMALPGAFTDRVRDLEAAYDQIERAVDQQDINKAKEAFSQFSRALDEVDGSLLIGHARMLWKELAMLLGNDAFEGGEVQQMFDADRLFLELKGTMRRMHDQLGTTPGTQPAIEHIATSRDFQSELAAAWERYLAIQEELAADQFSAAKEAVDLLENALADVNDSQLTGRAKQVWERERASLEKRIATLREAQDIQAMRAAFKPLSEEIGVVAKSFGFGDSVPVFELHCPMAFQNQGAVWYQASDQVRNPYFGSSMLKCADRVEKVVRDVPASPDTPTLHQDHSQH